jgi:hypothetical protein
VRRGASKRDCPAGRRRRRSSLHVVAAARRRQARARAARVNAAKRGTPPHRLHFGAHNRHCRDPSGWARSGKHSRLRRRAAARAARRRASARTHAGRCPRS